MNRQTYRFELQGITNPDFTSYMWDSGNQDLLAGSLWQTASFWAAEIPKELELSQTSIYPNRETDIFNNTLIVFISLS